MLDPITALAVAGNVLQLVEIGVKFIQNTTKHYVEIDYINDEQRALAPIIRNLKQIDSQLSQFPPSATLSIDHEPFVKAVVQACKECQDIIQEFDTFVSSCRVEGKSKLIQSIKLALKDSSKKKKIDALERRLGHTRAHLTITYLLYMNAHTTSQNEETVDAIVRSELRIKNNSDRFSKDLKRDLDNLGAQLDDIHLIDDRINDRLNAFYQNHRRIAQRFEQDFTVFTNSTAGQLDEVMQKMNILLASIERLQPEQTLPDSYAQIVEKNREEAVNEVLASLDFEEAPWRRQQIPEKHRRTLTWLFGPHDAQNEASAFSSWLVSPSAPRVFWVNGKPGSGKSTLMRYVDERLTQTDYLAQWNSNATGWATRQSIKASCFFWNAGTHMQRSFNGLLRSLLYQLCDEARYVVPYVVTRKRWSYASCHYGSSRTRPNWSMEELKDTLRDFVTRIDGLLSIFFLIDGLDEFDGSDEQRQDLVNFIDNLASFDYVKVCASSRPWNLFTDAYKNSPQIRLEDHTSNCISNYVNDKFNASREFLEMKEGFPIECEELTAEVVGKASGVFFWVFLVVRDLLKGMRDGASVRKLRTMLEKMPRDLFEFFDWMMKRVEPLYQREGSIFLQIKMSEETSRYAVRAAENGIMLPAPHLYELLYIDEDEPCANFFLDFECDVHDLNDVRAMAFKQKRMHRRLNSRCQGLLECHRRKSGLDTIEFCHRTVKEFLSTSEAKALLARYSGVEFDVHAFNFNVALAAIKAIQYGPQRVTEAMLGTFLQAQSLIKAQAGRNEAESVRMIDAMVKHICISAEEDMECFDCEAYPFGRIISQWKARASNTLSLAIQCHWTPYVRTHLTLEAVRNKQGAPLLSYAYDTVDGCVNQEAIDLIQSLEEEQRKRAASIDENTSNVKRRKRKKAR